MPERERAQIAVVIPAAGTGRRMGGDVSKPLLTLAGRSLLRLALTPLVDSGWLDVVVVVARPEELDHLAALLGDWPPITTAVVSGGAVRADSVRAGLSWLAAWPGWHPEAAHFVAVHDAARPLLTRDLWERVLLAALRDGAAVPGLPMADTLKRGDEVGWVAETVAREGIYAVQTPQVFNFEKLRAAYNQAHEAGCQVTDDAQAWELSGWPVRIVPGDPGNIKITTPADLTLAEALQRQRGEEDADWPGI